MKENSIKYSLDQSKTVTTNPSDCIVVPVFSKKNKAILHATTIQIDEACNGAISQLISHGDFNGKLEQVQILYALENISSPRVLLTGCGEQDKFDIAALNKATKAASNALKESKIKSVCFYLAEAFADSFAEKPAKITDRNGSLTKAITQIILAHADSIYQLNDYKSEKPPKSSLIKVTVGLTTESEDKAIKQVIGNATAITHGMRLSRDLANHPGNICTPTFLAKQAKSVAKEYEQISIDILEEKDMEKLGMGSFLSVSKGSDEPGKMIVLQYQGAKNKSDAPVALVGKGITFDTGGISLKPGASMDEMKFDMSGAASMLGALKACAEMKLPINLVVVLAAAENMPSARASKPGDIVTSMSGKTIEVLNTDAEGRLVLCDALTYVGKFKPEVVIDAATLTGACIIALGHHICAVLSNDDELAQDIMTAGNTINDRAWQLPMGDVYKQLLKSSFADLGNIGGRAAGTITAACFLAEFTKDYKWAHLDIAGTAWTDKDSTGRPVPLLCQYLINYANQ